MTVEGILKKLVSFSVLGGESNLSIIHWIKDYIEDFGVTTQLLPNEENTKASLHCRIGPAIDGGFILSGHTDVVPVTGQNWDTDPFVLTDKNDGKLYGRGSCDMKGFIACCLAALPKMTTSNLKKPIYFAFSYDEEIGCLAAPELVENIKSHYTEKPQYAIIGEPSLMQPVIGQKGICVMKTHVNGSAGHSSRIKQEVSAIHEAARLVLWLENKMNALVESGNLDQRFTPPHTSIHIGKFNGGIAPNVICDDVTFHWDIRVIPQDSVNDIINDFKAHSDQRTKVLKSIFPNFKITTTEIHPPVPPLDTNENDAIVEIIKTLTGNTQWKTVAFAAEAGQFAEGGFESIICGPGSIAQAHRAKHRANEYIAKDELVKGVEMLNKLVDKLIR